MDHKILLKELEHYGIRGIIALEWFKNYLSNRKQGVSLNGVMSDYKSVTYGVPQGSILGPLLFMLYNNDIINCSEHLIFILFADDTNLFFSCKNITHLFNIINTDLDKLAVRFRANRHIKKTNYFMFGNKLVSAAQPHRPNVSIDGQLLEQC